MEGRQANQMIAFDRVTRVCGCPISCSVLPLVFYSDSRKLVLRVLRDQLQAQPDLDARHTSEGRERLSIDAWTRTPPMFGILLQSRTPQRCEVSQAMTFLAFTLNPSNIVPSPKHRVGGAYSHLKLYISLVTWQLWCNTQAFPPSESHMRPYLYLCGILGALLHDHKLWAMLLSIRARS